MRHARVEKLFNCATWNYDLVLAAVIGKSKALIQERQHWADAVACYTQSVTDRTSQKYAIAAALYHCCDGCGLVDMGQIPAVNWCSCGM